MAFPEDFLDDLRSRLRVSAVVRADLKLRKEGHEFRAIDDNSVTVNDVKALWWDHAKGEGGDIFKWFEIKHGTDFPEAVKRCADLAGVLIPESGDRKGGGERTSRAPAKANGSHPVSDASHDAERDFGDRADDFQSARPNGAEAHGTTPKEIVAAYDYTDPQGSLLYQVQRLEWTDAGKRKKTFRQRRPDPDKPGEWINNLEGIEHGLYRIVELREADADEPVWLPEGEKDADTLWQWGLPATCNSGGAKNWRPDHAECLRDRDVVIPIDNDGPGREHGEAKAKSLRGIARRIRILDFAKAWPGAPKGADVSDWKKSREGTPEELSEIVDKLPDWHPPPPDVRFRLVRADGVKISAAPRYLIRGLIPSPGLVVVWGPPKCGKSFVVWDMLMHVATGTTYRGRRVVPGCVVYIALEGAIGLEARIEAYRMRSGLALANAPFYQVASRVDLVADHQRLIDDVRAQLGSVRPAAFAIDTLNRSLRGSESSDEDMGAYVKAADALIEAFSATVVVVHHCGVEGARPRGHSSLTGAADAQIAVRRDAEKNVLARVEFMKDGPEGDEFKSKLERVEIGRDEFNDPVTSCVVVPLEQSEQQDTTSFELRTDSAKLFYRCLIEALGESGGKAMSGLTAAPHDALVVHRDAWRNVLLRRAELAEEDDAKRKERIKKGLQRALDKFQQLGLIGVEWPWIWRTGKRVRGFPVAPHSQSAALAIVPDDAEGADLLDPLS